MPTRQINLIINDNEQKFKNISKLLLNGFTATDLIDERRFNYDPSDVFAAIIQLNISRGIRG